MRSQRNIVRAALVGVFVVLVGAGLAWGISTGRISFRANINEGLDLPTGSSDCPSSMSSAITNPTSPFETATETPSIDSLIETIKLKQAALSMSSTDLGGVTCPSPAPKPDGDIIVFSSPSESEAWTNSLEASPDEKVAAAAVAVRGDQIDRERSDFFAAVKAAGVPSLEIKTDSKIAINAVVVPLQSEDNITKILAIPGVEKIHPDYVMGVDLAESTQLIKANQVWSLFDASHNQIIGKGVKVAVIDSGIDYTHPDFGSCTTAQFLAGSCLKVKGGYNFVNNTGDPKDDEGHGTHVSGIVAASGAVTGVAPGATLYAYKVLNNHGWSSTSLIVRALERVIDPNNDHIFTDHLNVASVSLSSSEKCSQNLANFQAINNTFRVGVTVVVSAGNKGPLPVTIGTPGCIPDAITVGATYKKSYPILPIEFSPPVVDQIVSFSSRGPLDDPSSKLSMKPDVVAPGALICSTRWPGLSYPGDPYYTNCYGSNHIQLAGTSMSTPMVSGIAALILQAHPTWTPDQVKVALRNTAQKLNDPSTAAPYDVSVQGQGRVNALNAVGLSTAPSVAKIKAPPAINGDAATPIAITGTASGSGFRDYSVYVAMAPIPFYEFNQGRKAVLYSSEPTWNLLFHSTTSVTNGTLYNLVPTTLNYMQYKLKLVVNSSNGSSTDQTFLTVTSAVRKSTITSVNRDIWALFGKNESIVVPGTVGGTGFQRYDLKWCSTIGVCSTSGVTLINGGAQAVTNGTLGRWVPGPGFASSGLYGVLLTTYFTDGRKATDYMQIYIDTKQAQAWPKTIDNFININDGRNYAQPIIAPIEGAGKQDVVLLYSKTNRVGSQVVITTVLTVIGKNGTALPGFPRSWEGAQQTIGAAPVVGDLNGDGNKEIVFSSLDSNIHAIQKDGTELTGWPKRLLANVITGGRANMAISIADVTGSGKDDLIYLTYENNQTGQLSYYLNVVDGNGVQRPGWPKQLTTPIGASLTSSFTIGVAVGRSNAAHGVEIIAINTYSQVVGSQTNYSYSVWAFDSHGTVLQGWPAQFNQGGFPSQFPTLADITRDGEPEIIFYSENPNPASPLAVPNLYVHALSQMGAEISGGIGGYHWPALIPGLYNGYHFGDTRPANMVATNPVVGDIKGDGTVDVFVTVFEAGQAEGHSCIEVFSPTGTRLQGWPKCSIRDMFLGSPSLVHLNGSAELDVVVLTIDQADTDPFFSRIFAYKPNGSLVSGFPFTTDTGMNGVASVASGVISGDITQTNKNSLLALGVRIPEVLNPNGFQQLRLSRFDTTVCVQPSGWPQYNHDEKRSNYYVRAANPAC